MYPNLNAEIARRSLKLKPIADALEISTGTLSLKLRKGGFSFKEAVRLKNDVLVTDIPLEVLFEESDEQIDEVI